MNENSLQNSISNYNSDENHILSLNGIIISISTAD